MVRWYRHSDKSTHLGRGYSSISIHDFLAGPKDQAWRNVLIFQFNQGYVKQLHIVLWNTIGVIDNNTTRSGFEVTPDI